MKQIKKIMQPAKEIEILDFIKCDLCGKSTNKDDYESKSGNWDNTSTIGEKTVAIWTEEGYSCPDGGHKDAIIYDVCPNCFNEKVKPLLESLGLTHRKEVIEF